MKNKKKQERLTFRVWDSVAEKVDFEGRVFDCPTQLEDAIREREKELTIELCPVSILQEYINYLGLELLMSDGRVITNLDEAAEEEFKNLKK